MNSRFSEGQLRWYEALSCLLWVVMGVILAVNTLRSRQFPMDPRYTVLMLLASFLFLYAGLGYAMHLPGARGLVVVLSAILVLYALVLVLLGTEDVGGPWVSIPAAIVLVAFSVHNIVCVRLSVPWRDDEH